MPNRYHPSNKLYSGTVEHFMEALELVLAECDYELRNIPEETPQPQFGDFVDSLTTFRDAAAQAIGIYERFLKHHDPDEARILVAGYLMALSDNAVAPDLKKNLANDFQTIASVALSEDYSELAI